MAPKYREPIFQLMDKEMDIDWYFGKPIGDIKGLDPKSLKNATIIKRWTWKDLIWQRGILKHLRNKDYTIYIFTGEPYTISTWAFTILKHFIASKKKVYFWSHGWYGREGLLKKWMKRLFFRLADKTFLYGNYAKEVAISQGFPADKLAVIHNSLDHQTQLELRKELKHSDIYETYFGNNNPVLIFIGRLTRIKRLDLIINVISILKKQGKEFNVVFVGDGEKREELEKLVAEHSLEKQVWFYGACYDDTDTAHLIYDADLCIAPGNVGLTAMHSLVFGTPVLTHDNFPMQMPEFEAIKPGETGAFFKYNDVKSLAESISNWLSNNNSRRDEIRQNCYDEIDNYWTPEFQMNVLRQILNRS